MNKRENSKNYVNGKNNPYNNQEMSPNSTNNNIKFMSQNPYLHKEINTSILNNSQNLNSESGRNKTKSNFSSPKNIPKKNNIHNLKVQVNQNLNEDNLDYCNNNNNKF